MRTESLIRAFFSTRNSKLETRNFPPAAGAGRAGFTLLEILIVLMIVGLMLGLTGIYFASRVPSSRLDATARQIAAGIRHAGWIAISEGRDTIFTVDLDRKTYGVEGRRLGILPGDIAVSILDRSAGELSRGRHSVVARSGGGIEGETILLSSGRKTVKVQIDPVLGATVTVLDSESRVPG